MEYDINFDSKELNEFLKILPQGFVSAMLPNTAAAFETGLHLIRNEWVNYLSGADNLGIPPIEKPNASMIKSVQERQNSDLNYTVYSDSQQMQKLVNGQNPVYYDMKLTHPYGNKSRVTQSGPNKGVPYLIIPFRWGTPNGKNTKRRWSNFIPMAEYETRVLPLTLSERTDVTHFEKNAKGINIRRSEYNWDGRLKNGWDDRSAGLVRMKDEANGKSTYFTFRIISAKSKPGSWLYWKDGEDGVDIIGALKKKLEGRITKIIQQGLENDVQAYKS